MSGRALVVTGRNTGLTPAEIRQKRAANTCAEIERVLVLSRAQRRARGVRYTVAQMLAWLEEERAAAGLKPLGD